MKKKAIEKIPYLKLPENVKKGAKYVGTTAVKVVGHEKHLFLEVYRNKKASREIPLVRIVLTKKDFGSYFPEQEECRQHRDHSRAITDRRQPLNRRHSATPHPYIRRLAEAGSSRDQMLTMRTVVLFQHILTIDKQEV